MLNRILNCGLEKCIRFMKHLLLLSTLLFSISANAQRIPAMGMDEIIKSNASKDTLYIVNLWATWCVPCVQELPVFNKLYKEYAGQPVKVLLVSLDFKEDYPMKLATFLERKRILPPVVWLSDTNPNDFVPKVDKAWEGSIPATLIIHPGKGYKKFIEGQVTEREVEKAVKDAMKG